VALFRGTFDHTLDAKNRLTVPARYRSALAEGVVLAIPVNLKPCVEIWHPAAYDGYTRGALQAFPHLSSKHSELARFFYGGSHEIELDGAGRVIVPSFLSEHADLEKDVVIVGAGDHLELWSKERWDGHQPTLMQSVAEITAQVDDTA
jgi:MraZ protein